MVSRRKALPNPVAPGTLVAVASGRNRRTRGRVIEDNGSTVYIEFEDGSAGAYNREACRLRTARSTSVVADQRSLHAQLQAVREEMSRLRADLDKIAMQLRETVFIESLKK